MKNPKLSTRMERFVTMFRFVDGVAVWASPRTAVRAFRHRDGVLKEGVACLGRIGEGKEWCWGRRRGRRLPPARDRRMRFLACGMKCPNGAENLEKEKATSLRRPGEADWGKNV